MPNDEGKKWYTSKTFWVAIVVFVGSLLVEFGVMEAPFSEATLGIILSVLVVILRFITKEPIIWKG